MSSPESVQKNPNEYPMIPVQTGMVVVPRLRPDGFNSEKGFIPGNFDRLKPKILEALGNHSGFEALVKDVKEHKKSAIIVTSVGGLTIFVAAVAGYEFGIRHGRDIRQLFPQRKRK